MTAASKDLATLLKKRSKPPGRTPKEWLFAAKLDVPSGSLFVGDPHLDPDDAYVAKVPSGTYIVEAKLKDAGGEWWTSRLRVRLEESEEPTLGKKIGDTCTDIAAFGFYDLSAVNAAIAGKNDDFVQLLLNKNFSRCGLIQIKMKEMVTIAFVETNFDCGARVFELRNGRKRIGVEVEIEFEELEAFLEEEAAAKKQRAKKKKGRSK